MKNTKPRNVLTMEDWASWPQRARYDAQRSLYASPMTVRSACIEMQVLGSRSLKDKRSVIKSMIAKVKHRYSIAIAEVGHQDNYHLAALGIAVVSGEADHAADYLETVIRFIELDDRVEITSINRN